jgi:hypothetical protein
MFMSYGTTITFPQLYAFWTSDFKRNENWVTIEPELGLNKTSTECQFENFMVMHNFYWVLVLFLMGSFSFIASN